MKRFLLAIVIAAGAPLAAQSQAAIDAQFLEYWKAQPKVNLNVPADGAKVVIVKFNDWMCPGCKILYEQMKPVLAKYQARPGAIKYVEKDLPWDTACNPASGRTIPGHEASCAAAAAVRLAADRGKRDVMAEWMYANQPASEEQRRTMLSRVHAKTAELLGIRDFPAAYQTKIAAIRNDTTQAQALKVQSTPTYFINGVRAAGPDGSMIQLRYVEAAIEYELNKK
jgi:protein-disulfide isomerase